MQIESIKLLNFQAHAETEIQFSPTITTLKGPTDRGKSSVLRALRWVCLNSITGDEFIREGEKLALVEIRIRSGKKVQEIQRTRGGSINGYSLGEDIFKAFGTGVPDQIANLLAVNEINFQQQHDPPFWFSDSAGEVSRKLNAVIDLRVIDSSLSYIGTEVRRAHDRIAICKERLIEAQNELEAIEPQRARVGQFQQLKELHDSHAKTKESHHRLDQIISAIGSNQARRLREQADEGGELVEKIRNWMAASKRRALLFDILESLQVQQTKSTPPPDFSPVLTARRSWVDLHNKAVALEELIQRIGERRLAVDAKKEAAKATEVRFHQKVKGTECPLCGNQIL